MELKKVKVRVCVSVDKNGKWSASGWGSKTHAVKDDDLISYSSECLDIPFNSFFLNVEIDIPQCQEIKAEVENGA